MITKPDGTCLYTLTEASKKFGIPKGQLYQAHQDGMLKVRLRRGTKSPYYVGEQELQEWFQEGFETV